VCVCVFSMWQRVGCGWKISFEICIGCSLRARAVCGNNCMACGLILNECSFSPLLSQVIWVCMRGAEYVLMLYSHQVNLNGSFGIWFCLKEDDCEICWARTRLYTLSYSWTEVYFHMSTELCWLSWLKCYEITTWHLHMKIIPPCIQSNLLPCLSSHSW